MDRRAFITLVGGSILAAPLAAEAQQPSGEVPRIGAIQAAQRATETIPIVMAFSNDPVESGFVASLARPGANITGLSLVSAPL